MVKCFGKTLTVDPYVCIDVAHREKTAPLGFCESIFLIKDAMSLCQPCCAQLMQVILCCLTEGLLTCSVLGQPPRAHSLHRQKLCFTDKELEMEELGRKDSPSAIAVLKDQGPESRATFSWGWESRK